MGRRCESRLSSGSNPQPGQRDWILRKKMKRRRIESIVIKTASSLSATTTESSTKAKKSDFENRTSGKSLWEPAVSFEKAVARQTRTRTRKAWWRGWEMNSSVLLCYKTLGSYSWVCLKDWGGGEKALHDQSWANDCGLPTCMAIRPSPISKTLNSNQGHLPSSKLLTVVFLSTQLKSKWERDCDSRRPTWRLVDFSFTVDPCPRRHSGP